MRRQVPLVKPKRNELFCKFFDACRENSFCSVKVHGVSFFFESGNRSTFGQVKLGTLVSRAFSLLSLRTLVELRNGLRTCTGRVVLAGHVPVQIPNVVLAELQGVWEGVRLTIDKFPGVCLQGVLTSIVCRV